MRRRGLKRAGAPRARLLRASVSIAVLAMLTGAGRARAGGQGAKPAAAGRTAYADVNGLHMYYEEYGSGPPLVLLHGGGSTVQTSFGRIIGKLAQGHHVIAPEQQDHGHSGDRAGPPSFEQMADDTAALLAQLGVMKADVLGFSNGGIVALELARRHPDLVHRLVLCSSFYARDAMPAAFWQGFDKATMADMPRALREAFIASAPNKAEIPARFTKLVALMKDFHDIPTDALGSLAAPTLIMVGDRDVMSVEHEAALARLLPHAKLAVFPGSGHGTYLGTAEGGPTDSALVPLSLAMIEGFLSEGYVRGSGGRPDFDKTPTSSSPTHEMNRPTSRSR